MMDHYNAIRLGCMKQRQETSSLVAHIVMWVNQRVCTLFLSDVVDSVSEFAEVLTPRCVNTRTIFQECTHSFVELASKSKFKRTHAFHKEGYTEEVNFFFVYKDIDSALKDD